MKAPPRGTRRIAFAGYAAALATATHWPALALPAEAGRSDLFIHAALFGGWTLLFMAAEPFGPWHRARSIAFCTVVAAAYAGLDEGTQAIPALRRVAAWDDFAANSLGIAAACVLAIAAAKRARRGQP